MPKPKALKYVYSDGSAFNSHGKFGAGWVITNESGRRLSEASIRLPLPHDANSQIAEILAVTLSLNSLGRRSRIVLHCDDSNLCKQISRQIFGHNLRGRKKLRLEKHYIDLFNAVARHKEVKVVQTNDRESALIKNAHQLAQAGAQKEMHEQIMDLGETDKIAPRRILKSLEALRTEDLSFTP